MNNAFASKFIVAQFVFVISFLLAYMARVHEFIAANDPLYLSFIIIAAGALIILRSWLTAFSIIKDSDWDDLPGKSVRALRLHYERTTLYLGQWEDRVLIAGILGTCAGFLMIAIGIDIEAISNDRESLILAVASMIKALSIAFLTTMSGLVMKIMINFNHQYINEAILAILARREDENAR